MELDIGVDDPRAPDVSALLAVHLAFSQGVTPVEYSFALDVDRLAEPDVTFFSARAEGELVAVAALKRLDGDGVELKSMHTRQTDRGRGVGTAMVDHVVGWARGHSYRRIYLETGTTDEFVAARRLYAKLGFVACEAFADYRPSPYNTFMSMEL